MDVRRVPCWLIDLCSDLRLEQVLDRIIENAVQAFPGREFALLTTLDERLTVVRTSGIGPAARRRLERWARSSFGMASEPVAIDDLQDHPQLGRLATRLSHGALRALPLLSKGSSLGALIALVPDGGQFGDEDCELLEAFAEQSGAALANAHAYETLLENATRDALTELPNRREFDRMLTRELERSRRYGEIFSLAILDLDQFKQLNDAHGHEAGDRALRDAAQTIREVCRASDMAGRLGGDEFAVLLPETNQFEAAAFCERLRAQIERLGDVSLSWGVAEYPTHGVTTTTLSRAADAAMYASKPRLVGGVRALGAR